MDLYREYISLSRYARWLPEKNRRETWPETVDRYFSFFRQRMIDRGTYNKHVEQMLGKSQQFVLEHKAMPSMRCMMTAGDALDRDEVAGYNPVVGNTLVLTKEWGLQPIKDFENRTATVLNKDGKWTPASFRKYGEQKTFIVRTRLNSNTVNEVECTANHRWVLSSGVVKATQELVQGDRIDFVSAPKPEINDENHLDYRLGVVHGLVYGDGTSVYSQERLKGYNIRLCGSSKELLPWFGDYKVTWPPSFDGDPVVMLYNDFAKTHALKDLPDACWESDEYLLGFIRGWMAADGSVSKASQVSICMDLEGKEWFEKNAPALGFVVQRSYKQKAETNYGKRKKESWVLSISRSSCTVEDFLIKEKANRFKPLDSHYVVESVRGSGIFYKPVFCAEVPDTNTFVLDKGLVTGNCSYDTIGGAATSLEVLTEDMKSAGFAEPITVNLSEPHDFDEIMYILLCGTGVGFSVERQYINDLPVVGHKLPRSIYTRTEKNFPGVPRNELSTFYRTGNRIRVADSKYGWASAIRILITELYNGNFDITWDLSKVRPAGAKLKTFGGRASGPDPLARVFEFIKGVFTEAKGRKLTSIECHDIVCKIAESVVVGGVRRAALISLSNLTDQRMAMAKSGAWYDSDIHRQLANNSIAFTEKPDVGIFMREWNNIYESKSGERGFFNRVASKRQAGSTGRRDPNQDFGTNPCSEIILRPKQFCNLSEVVVRHDDTLDDLRDKVRVATFLGTLQATLTNFRYLRPIWRQNTEEEALLGVSLTGIMDHPILSGREYKIDWTDDGRRYGEESLLPAILRQLKQEAISENAKWANIFQINRAAAISCVKPSGTVSQLVDSASGIHARHSPYYIRRVRADKKDPLGRFMEDKGFPVEYAVGAEDSVSVFSFPVKAPEGAITRDDLTAIEQLEHWKIYQDHWSEHKPSITVTVRDHEWPEVGAWVWENFDSLSGVSFLPHTDHVYPQLPYEEITKEQYDELAAKLPTEIDWSALSDYEKEDTTTGTQELSCSAGSCEIVDTGV